jgi:hypothetical protein
MTRWSELAVKLKKTERTLQIIEQSKSIRLIKKTMDDLMKSKLEVIHKESCSMKELLSKMDRYRFQFPVLKTIHLLEHGIEIIANYNISSNL